MAVVLADGVYRVAHRPWPWPQDDHGTPVPPAATSPGPARPGAATETPDGQFSLRLDPADWPVRAGDTVTGPGGASYTVTGNPRLHRNAAASDVDYISALATRDEGPASAPFGG